MAYVIEDRVLETSTTTGTGDYTLAGAVTGFIGFSNVPGIADGDICPVYVEEVDSNGVPSGGWETGIYRWNSSGDTLTRELIINSSNANAAVNWSAGTRRISISLIAEDMGLGSGLLLANGNFLP